MEDKKLSLKNISANLFVYGTTHAIVDLICAGVVFSIFTKQIFNLDKGLDITVRAKMNTTAPGIVGGIFLYALKPGSNTIHDEIDFELLKRYSIKFRVKEKFNIMHDYWNRFNIRFQII